MTVTGPRGSYDALLLVSFGIVGYLAMRFEWRFAVAAIIATGPAAAADMQVPVYKAPMPTVLPSNWNGFYFGGHLGGGGGDETAAASAAASATAQAMVASSA